MLKNGKFTILFISWMVFVTILSLSPLSGLGNVTRTINIPHIDKFVHFTFYFVATILGSFFLREFKKNKIDIISASDKMFFFSVCYGMIIEVFQYCFTANRHGDFFDFIANSIGALFGWLVMKYVISNQVAQK